MSPKTYLGTSSAELVYGSTLTIPGEFIAKSDDPTIKQHLTDLRQFVKKLAPKPTNFHGTTKKICPTNILNWKFVFVRRDMHKNPLRKPYDGPFKVIETGEKNFKTLIGDQEDTVTVDLLKPAFVGNPEEVILAEPKRRGRPPKKKKKHQIR